MERLPNLGSLRSIANYGEDEVDSDDENMTRKKMKVSVEEESKEDASDLDIVLSDEEGDSSRPSSTENKVTVSQPRVNIGNYTSFQNELLHMGNCSLSFDNESNLGIH